jgi:hypothetical protein
MGYCQLEDRFPDRPPLFGGAVGRGVADWRSRMTALYDNLGDRFPGYPS